MKYATRHLYKKTFGLVSCKSLFLFPRPGTSVSSKSILKFPNSPLQNRILLPRCNYQPLRFDHQTRNLEGTKKASPTETQVLRGAKKKKEFTYIIVVIVVVIVVRRQSQVFNVVNRLVVVNGLGGQDVVVQGCRGHGVHGYGHGRQDCVSVVVVLEGVIGVRTRGGVVTTVVADDEALAIG